MKLLQGINNFNNNFVRSSLTDIRLGPPIFMKSSKLVCGAAIFVQTVSFMRKLSMETRQPTVSACPLLWICWDKLKEIKLKILECVVLSPSLYMLIQLFSSISLNSGF